MEVLVESENADIQTYRNSAQVEGYATHVWSADLQCLSDKKAVHCHWWRTAVGLCGVTSPSTSRSWHEKRSRCNLR